MPIHQHTLYKLHTTFKFELTYNYRFTVWARSKTGLLLQTLCGPCSGVSRWDTL